MKKESKLKTVPFLMLAGTLCAAQLPPELDIKPRLHVRSNAAARTSAGTTFYKHYQDLNTTESLLDKNKNLYNAYTCSMLLLKYLDVYPNPLELDDVQAFVQAIVSMPIRMNHEDVKESMYPKKMQAMLKIQNYGIDYLYNGSPIDSFALSIVMRYKF